jgi:hypothetical protein
LLLSHRPANSADFNAASASLAPWYGLCAEELAKAWPLLLEREGVWSLVIEDVSGPPKPLSLSLSVFISDRLADRIEAGRCPRFGNEIVSRLLTRGDEPLSIERIRVAHHGAGLNLVSLHTVGLDVELGNSSAGMVSELRSRVCFEALRGYNIKRCLREVYTSQALNSFLAGGWKLRDDYSRFFGEPTEGPTLQRPYLLGVVREESDTADNGGARMAAMFHRYPIRLSLRRVHRELLEAALEGLTDSELSSRLSLSPSAIKKRWASVYDRVEGLIPGLPPANERSDKTRGAERRRHVLNYLRDHPEEFRPLHD